MVVFRILCAGALACALGWALSRPEAAGLLRRIPEMAVLGPLAAAYVGGFNLAVRQGWGAIVAFTNGIWAGILAIVAAGVLYLAVEMARALATGEVTGFGSFLGRFGEIVDLLVDELGHAQLLVLALAAAACAGLLTEALHWLMVRVRERHQRSN
jgi:hypothetical protein